MAQQPLDDIIDLEESAEDLLRRYDASEDAVEQRALKAQLLGLRASLSTSAYTNGPVVGQNDFGCILSARPEFSRSVVPLPSPDDAKTCEGGWFMLTPLQIFVKHFMSVHDALLLFHAVGTGKSCTAITTAEYLRDTGVFKKKALILVPRYLKQAFIKQIFDVDKLTDPRQDVGNQCTGDKYLRMAASESERTRESLPARILAIQKLVSARYDVMTYGKFARVIQKKVSDIEQRVADAGMRQDKIAKALEDIVSDRLIVMDEVHNIKIAGTGEEDGKVNAPMIKLALQHARNTKLLLMTATPMFDQADEIVWLLNLMRYAKGQPEMDTSEIFGADGQFKRGGEEVLRTAVSGSVSYLNAENPWTYPVRLDSYNNKLAAAQRPTHDMKGIVIPAALQLRETNLAVSFMSAEQQRSYESLLPRVLRIEKKSKDEDRSKSGLTGLLQLSNMYWPDADASEDDASLRSCLLVTEKKGHKRYAYHARTLSKHGRFLSATLLGRHSPKMHSIVESIRSSTGVVYVYSQFLSGGLIPLALALEHAGVQPYQPDRRMWASADEANIDKPITVNGKTAKYIMLWGEQAPDAKEIEAARSSANAMGEIIKVVICSVVGTEGVDLRHVREVHIMEPWYNSSRVQQAFGRAVRRCSHFDLPLEMRNVTLFRHAVMLRDRKTESVDYHVYRQSENKLRVVERVHAIMRQQAVDCHLTNSPLSQTNVPQQRIALLTSQGRTIKDFLLTSVPQHDCAPCQRRSPTAQVGQYDVRDNLSAVLDGVDEYKRLVVAPLFAQRVHYTFAELVAKARDIFKGRYDEDTLSACMQHMLVRHSLLTGPLDGERGYLIYQGGEYIFQPFAIQDTTIPLLSRSGAIASVVPALRVAVDVPKRQKKRQDGGGPLKRGSCVADTRLYALESAIAGLWKGACAWFGQQVMADFVVDRMSSMELEDTTGRICRAAHEGKPLTTSDLRVLRSLRDAGMWKKQGRTYTLYVPVAKVWRMVLPSGEIIAAPTMANSKTKSKVKKISNVEVERRRALRIKSGDYTRKQLQDRLRAALPKAAVAGGVLHAPTPELLTLLELCERIKHTRS